MKRLKEYQAPLTDCWGRVVFEANFMASVQVNGSGHDNNNANAGLADMDWEDL